MSRAVSGGITNTENTWCSEMVPGADLKGRVGGSNGKRYSRDRGISKHQLSTFCVAATVLGTLASKTIRRWGGPVSRVDKGIEYQLTWRRTHTTLLRTTEQQKSTFTLLASTLQKHSRDGFLKRCSWQEYPSWWKTGKQPKCPTTEDLLKWWYPHPKKYFAAVYKRL